MNHKKQRIASIIIGIIISILLIVIGLRIVQRRQSKATAPKNVICRIEGSEGIVNYTSADPEPGIVNYATEASYNANQQFPFIAEADNSPQAVEGGLYEQEIKIGPLVANTVYVVKVGEQTVNCQPSSGTSQQDQAESGDNEPAIIEPTQAELTSPAQKATPTTMDIPEADPTSETTLTDAPAETFGTGLSPAKVDTYYKDYPDGSIKDCADNFKNETDTNGKYYTNLGQICAEGWAKNNL